MSRGVLVIEADHDTRVSARRVLEDAGYYVVSSTNAADALSLLGQVSPPTAILISTALTLMTAEQFLIVVRSEPKYSPIPIFHLRENGEPQLAGASESVEKPIRAPELLAKLRSIEQA